MFRSRRIYMALGGSISIKSALIFLVVSLLPFGANALNLKFTEAQKSANKNYQEKRFEAVLSNLDDAMHYSSTSNEKIWVFNLQFSVLMQMKNFDAAFAVMEKAVRSSFVTLPVRNQYWLNQIGALYQLKKYSEALLICDKIISSTCPDGREAAYDYKCQLYNVLKEYNKMLDTAIKLTEYAKHKHNDSMYIRGKNHQITALLRQEKYDKAMTVFTNDDYVGMTLAEKLNYHIRQSDIYQSRKNFAAAIEILDKAYKLPELTQAEKNQVLFSKLYALYRSDKLQDSLALCEKLAAGDRREEMYNLKCQICYRLKEYDKMLDTAVKLTLIAVPDSPMYYAGKRNQITALVCKADYARAMTVFTDADVDRMSAETKTDYYNTIGGLYRAQKDYAAAASSYEKSGLASNTPNAITGDLNAADMYALSDRNTDVLRLYAKVFNNPKVQTAQRVIAIYKSAELLNKTGKYADALAMTAKIDTIPDFSKLYWASGKLLAARIFAELDRTTEAKIACDAAKRGFESIILASDSSEADTNMALDGFTECDLSTINKSTIGMLNVKEGDFVLKTNLSGNEDLKISYLVPVDAQGEPLPTANNIVFYAPFAGERNPLRNPYLRYFAEKLGFTIFSLNIELDLSDIEDRQKYYIYPEVGWHEIVFVAQQKLIDDFKLKPQKLLVVGVSAGGSMAQLMAVHHSDKIDAVAMIGGGTMDPVSRNSKIAWLALNTWGCWYTSVAQKFKAQAQTQGVQVLRGETPFVLKTKDNMFAHHGADSFAWRLMQTFIKDAVVLREKNNSIMPSVEQWPIVETISQEKQYLPSSEFATLWKQLPHEGTALFENEAGIDDSHKYIIVEPPSGHVRGIVLFIHDPLLYESVHLMDNLYFLAKKDNIAVSVKMGDDHFKALEKIKNALDFILKNDEWSKLPIYVQGSGAGGRLAAVAALSNGNSRIKRIATLNSEYMFPLDELSIASYRNKSRIPLKMLAGNKNYSIPQKIHDTDSILIESKGINFDKWWFYLLARTAE